MLRAVADEVRHEALTMAGGWGMAGERLSHTVPGDRMHPRRLYRCALSVVRMVLAIAVGATALSVLSAAGVVSVGLLTASPAGAYLGCPVGGGAVKGEVKVASGGPPMARIGNTSYNGDLMTQNTAFPQNVNPGGSGAFHYCGKSVFTWPVETKTQYRINGPRVGKDLTGYIVDVFTKIPFKGDNEYTCSVSQEFGPKTVDPFYCSPKGTDAGSRYAIIADFTVGLKKVSTITNEHEQARLLADHCAKQDLTRCVFDSKNLNTNVYGPQEPVTDAVDATCTHDLPFTFNWTQTIATTENIGASASVTVAIGSLVPIVQANVAATYGFSWTQSRTAGGTYPYTVPKGHRMHLVRSAKLNEVTGSFLLAGSGDTNYLIPHATFKWMDRSETGIISPKLEQLAGCPTS